jgi:hypothetical protein
MGPARDGKEAAMISKSVKNKRRAQAREARLIEAALYGAADMEGRFDTDRTGRFLTCHALNIQDGIAEIPAFARFLARFPRGSGERAWMAANPSPCLCTALRHMTADYILEQAGHL